MPLNSLLKWWVICSSQSKILQYFYKFFTFYNEWFWVIVCRLDYYLLVYFINFHNPTSFFV